MDYSEQQQRVKAYAVEGEEREEPVSYRYFSEMEYQETIRLRVIIPTLGGSKIKTPRSGKSEILFISKAGQSTKGSGKGA